jgi:hypothetical protein
MFLNYFDEMMLKIIFFKIIIKYYFNDFQTKNTLKSHYYYTRNSH